MRRNAAAKAVIKDLERSIDGMILDQAATDAASALLMVEAYLMQLGPTNARSVAEEGRVIHAAVREAMDLSVLVAKFERDYPGESGWGLAHRAIADTFGSPWADATLGWALRLETGPVDLEPGTESLVRWALSLPAMGDLLSRLDALLMVGSDGDGEAAHGAREGVRDSIKAVVARGVQPERLREDLRLWSRATGGPAITIEVERSPVPRP